MLAVELGQGKGCLVALDVNYADLISSVNLNNLVEDVSQILRLTIDLLYLCNSSTVSDDVSNLCIARLETGAYLCK